ncbi:MAG: deoxyhypusine synthase family protein [Deltaproteobacteria bacterium]|nr:deoxyhypusine synthase family protein [Deltaproteobacteria bacterium]
MMSNVNRRNTADYGNGLSDRLEPLSPIDIKRTEDFDHLLRQMQKTSFTGRSLGEAAEVLAAMVADEKCLVVATFSGAMTVAKMGLLICDMIDWGWINIIVSTGALVAHGFVEAAGMLHFKHRGEFDDEMLYRRGYNRIYDTLELEKNLDRTERIIGEILDKLDTDKPFSSELLCRELGRWLAGSTREPGILRSAFLKEVPVYIPAFTDSELALDVASWMVRQNMKRDEEKGLMQALSEMVFAFNPFLDLASYTRRVLQAERLGIFTIGGGVPRNWAQQVSPFLEILQHRCSRSLPLRKFSYGVRICPEPAHWGGLSGCTYSEGVSWGKFHSPGGGLSGCTYSEGVSWGKFHSPGEGGRFAEVLCDATVAWPILVRGVKERLDKQRESTNSAAQISGREAGDL